MNKSQHTLLIKQEAKRLGFDSCGISKAEFLHEEAPRLERYLKEGMHSKMSYMENYFDKRLDPRLLVPGAKSVISVILNYYPNEIQKQDSGVKISKYAYGTDYHFVVRDKLNLLLSFIQTTIGKVEGRGFVDSAPVMDKVWAKKSGLGWIGKNSTLLVKSHGSFYFLAELIIDLELDYDHEIPDYCGSCTKCIDACPTDAIIEPHVVDGSKCISYFTIELKDQTLPSEMQGKFEDWMFGCDICQDVCPWNSFATPTNEPHFKPIPQLLNFNRKDWEEMKEETFRKTFKDSPLKRSKYNGIKRNLEFLNLSNRMMKDLYNNIPVSSEIGQTPNIQ